MMEFLRKISSDAINVTLKGHPMTLHISGRKADASQGITKYLTLQGPINQCRGHQIVSIWMERDIQRLIGRLNMRDIWQIVVFAIIVAATLHT